MSAGVLGAFAQGTLSGEFMANANFYVRDSAINANNQLYNNYKSGGEAWLGLRYNYKGFTATLRMDAMQNSNLYLPGTPYTTFGIGSWSLSKDIGKASITGGYIYDQIGSGILFRSYEDRGLLIDNALVGARVKYQLTDNINIKAMVGQQKDVSAVNKFYGPIIKTFSAEGDFQAGNVHLSPGVGALNRTMDQTSMNAVVSSINNMEVEARFVPRYNNYAFTAYNTLSVGNFSWYAEGSYKTHEAIVDPYQSDSLYDAPGSVVYTTLGYAQKGIAVNLTGKRTENFSMRTSPNETLIRGIMNWQPIIARLHPQRLMARYTPASQDLSEQGTNMDLLITPNDNLTITTDFTYINNLNNIELYREAYGEFEYRGMKKWLFDGGVQYMHYNQQLYQVTPVKDPIVKATTPFLEVTYRINRKQSLRFEGEYMFTKQDYGDWAFALLEYNIAPKWSFSASDMYPTHLNPNNRDNIQTAVHYFNVFGAFTQGANRFTLSYVRQPSGINCTGGVCRYEPAFNGLKIGLTSSF
ncbi:hypothetical protein DN068_06460 [Taibaiella soli]|uniref:Uncharacterized protein n=2 Tax=Taibaiella soli TaxID=1649169 RepID=A0A2W2BKI3_9BACT|nr:hypothetical protein DN068_06460 [Taibaiella soli]